MIEIIPSINVNNFEELKEKIRLVEPYVNWAHIDVSDGVFTKHVSWHDPKEFVGFQTSLKLEVHLMIDRPEREIDEWAIVPADRIIFHQEATSVHKLILDKIRGAKKETGIAIKPDTNWIKLFPYFDSVDLLQLLAVNPGPSGQEFQEEILHKLGHIHSLHPQAIIEVDGGVNPAVARRCTRAGAEALVAGSSVFSSKDIGAAIEKLKNVTQFNSDKFLSHLPKKTPVNFV
ncbi:MAG: ribulose-phosphate 3-epimerase [Patescibacteria group bacterium]